MKRFLILLLLVLPGAMAASGNMKLLAVSNVEDNPQGSTADLYLEVKPGSGRVFIDSFPLTKLDTQISTRFAKEVACNFLEADCSKFDFYYTIRANSAIVGGPSASAATTVLTVSVLENEPLDSSASITGTINTGGIIGPVGGILPKIEAASKEGITTVIIPKYTQVNQTNLSEYEEKYGVDVIEVSQLTEALTAMTSKDYTVDKDITVSQFYTDTMKELSEDLCDKAGRLSQQVELEENSSSLQLLQRAQTAIDNSEHYSAASYCFGAGLGLRYSFLEQQDLEENEIKGKIQETLQLVRDFRNVTQQQELETITDLETYMVVSDRLLDSQDRLNEALVDLAQNRTNSSLYNLAYGIERLNSAHSWAVFFEKPGKEFNIKSNLDESCLKKISEVEERIQYVEFYLPTNPVEVKQSLQRSYNDYNNGEPELCLYKSSIAKARLNLILNNLAVNADQLDEVIEDRSSIVEAVIAKQNERGISPILAYSYYEYANSLKESDPYSALLYLEYALELGNLDIYFERKQISLPAFRMTEITWFALGASTGILLSVMIIALKKK